MDERPCHSLLWAKADRSGQYHPLICHLIDVAQVAEAVWDRVLTDSMRGHFCSLLGLPPGESGRLLSFWIGLHDLGKASPAFQRRCQSAQERLAAAGLSFPKVFARPRCQHGTISAQGVALHMAPRNGESPSVLSGAESAAISAHQWWKSGRSVPTVRTQTDFAIWASNATNGLHLLSPTRVKSTSNWSTKSSYFLL